VNNYNPSSFSSMITKAVGALVIAAIVLYVVEKVFLGALPELLVILILLGVYRIAIGIRRQRDGW
jgi:hypothetical protein